MRLVAYPSVGPETFSFTLSEAWAAGRPVVVPPIGALAERVAASGGGWVLSDEEWRDDVRMLERIAALLAPEGAEAYAAAAARAKATPQPTLAMMAEATSAIWRSALSQAPASAALPLISAGRCLEALHYAPWRPAAPPVEAPEGPAVLASAPKPNGALAVVARAALAIRHTFAGRALYRLAPKPLVDALRQRL